MRHSAGTWSGKTSEVPSFRLMAIAEIVSHSEAPNRDTLSGTWPAPPDCRVAPKLRWNSSCFGGLEPQTGTIPPQLMRWDALRSW